MQAVARLSPEARADFRAVVETIAIRWQSSFRELAPVAERRVSGAGRCAERRRGAGQPIVSTVVASPAAHGAFAATGATRGGER